MKHERFNYIAVGLFVLAMGAVLLVTLYKLTGRSGPTDQYHAYFRNVTGLKFGTPVYYEGFHIGQVEEITPHNGAQPTRFRVDFSVRQGWSIPIDSEARLLASGLLAAMSIDIHGGQSEQLLKPGSQLTGREAANLFAVVNEVAAEIRELSDQGLKPLLSNMNRRIDDLAGHLDAHLPGILVNANQLTQKLLTSSEAVEQLLGEDNRNVIAATITDLKQAASDFRRLAADLNKTRVSVDGTVQTAMNAADATNRLIQTGADVVAENRADIRSASADLRHTLDVLATRLDAILYNLEGSSRNIKEFSRTVRDNPSVLISSDRPQDPVRSR
jgi:phospholipid/cholesterol/gamma-HCH transport system substrate-binding protein